MARRTFLKRQKLSMTHRRRAARIRHLKLRKILILSRHSLYFTLQQG